MVGLDLHDAPDRVRNAAQQSDIKAWVVQNEKVLADWPGLFEGARLVLLLNDPPTLPPGDQVIPYRRLLDGPALSPVPWPNPDDLATLIFTSGTTGEPKGVPYTHRQLTHAVRAIARAYRGLPEGFQSLCWLPLSNLFQRMVNLCAMERGAVITFVPHPNQLVESLPLVRPELLIGVPRFYEKLEAGIRNAVAAKPWGVQALFRWSLAVGAAYRTGRHAHNTLRFFLWPLYQTLDGLVLRVVRQRFGGRLRYLVSGAAALNPKTIQFFWGLGLSTLEAYGTSENAIPIALNRPGAFAFGTTGQPLGPNEVQIGPDREVLVKGPSLFTGYWNQPREASLFQGSYFRTGDEGRWEPGGFLKLLGRLSEIIKTSTGRRLAPGPIEHHFKAVPFVDQAVVLGNGRKGPALLVTIDPSRLGLTENAEGGFSPALKEKVEKDLVDQAARLPSLSQPLGILVLHRAFSVLRGEITSNLKIRRRAIEHHYGSILDTLYEEAVGASGPTVWFLSSSDTRMQEFATLPVLHRLKTSVILRWISLGFFFLRAGAAYAKYSWNLYRAPWNFKKYQFTLFETLIRLFRNTVGPLKGPLVKIGQTLSFVDLGLPPALQGLLREIQYKTQPLSAKIIRNIIRRSLGKDPRDLFLDWHDIPLASASISQIHLARLKDGRRVAVKVRYPGIEQIVKSDLVAVKALLPLVSAMTGVRNVRENFEEAKRLLLGECDFRKELIFMKRFKAIFAGHPRIVIPAVYPEFCSKDVLTMDYIEGQSYAEYKATASPAEIDLAGETIYEMLAVSSLRHGLFQADPHPGNYIFRNGQVYFLDFGFCKEWSKEFVSQWKRQTRAVLNNDLAAFSDATEKLGMRLQEGRMNYEQMLRGFRNSVERFLLEDRPFRLTTEFVKEVNRDLQKHALSAQGLFVSPEMLAQGRLFWGQNSLYADLGCNVNFHRIILSVLNEGEHP
ncbi:MAG: AMP-binding protein [Elusimicrobia bacterium]|nr:AMP-binding protein [Elusimicrobiota bacterium]